LVRANYGLRVGKFEMDFEDGELRFQASQILDGDAVGGAVIDRMIGTARWCTGTKSPGRRLGARISDG
jgi:hypothetical protein